MPDNGLTIDGLNSVSAITANDEIPVWDAEAAPNEPTKKITGSNLAASIKTLGSLLGTSDVVNDLTSTATTVPLSANMGKVLNDNFSKNTLLFSGDMTTEKAVYTFSENATNYLFVAVVAAWSNINFPTGYFLIPTVKWTMSNNSDETRVYLNNNPNNDYFSMYNRAVNQISAKVSNTSVKVAIYGICKIT